MADTQLALGSLSLPRQMKTDSNDSLSSIRSNQSARPHTRYRPGADELLVLLLRQHGRDNVAPAVDGVLERGDEIGVAGGLEGAEKGGERAKDEPACECVRV